jgi:hypothetical protein
MAAIADMTLEDLKALIVKLIEEQRTNYFFGQLDMDDVELNLADETDNRSLEEVFESIEQNRWTPPVGTPSPAEMIREDRDSR